MKPTLGREVRFVLDTGPGKGQVRTAKIVRVWSDQVVNLHVCLDGGNDAGTAHPDTHGNTPLVIWKASVTLGGPAFPGTWFWPEIVTPKPNG